MVFPCSVQFSTIGRGLPAHCSRIITRAINRQGQNNLMPAAESSNFTPLLPILIPASQRGTVDCTHSKALMKTWPANKSSVIDDGSTDRSVNVIRTFGDRINFQLAAHQGGNATRIS